MNDKTGSIVNDDGKENAVAMRNNGKINFATFWKMELQFYGKMICNFLEKCLAKNNRAVQALVNLVAQTKKCSANMNYVPQPTIVPSKSWFFKQALRPLKDWLQGGTATYETCRSFRYSQLKDVIRVELQTGE